MQYNKVTEQQKHTQSKCKEKYLTFEGKFIDCHHLFNCCDCGGNDCGCRYCFSCNACEHCLNSEH